MVDTAGEPSNFIEMDISGREEEEQSGTEEESQANHTHAAQTLSPRSDNRKGDSVPERTGNGPSGPSIQQKGLTREGLQRAPPPRRNDVNLKPPRPPKSSYYFGPPNGTSAYGTDPIGTIGLHHPREIVRVERDYEHGELCQFSSAFPLELEGRLTPTQFLESINSINEILISAHSVKAATIDNAIAILTLYLSSLSRKTHYEKEMARLHQLFDQINHDLFNSRGLRMLWPRRVGFLFLEIEFY